MDIKITKLWVIERDRNSESLFEKLLAFGKPGSVLYVSDEELELAQSLIPLWLSKSEISYKGD